MAERKVLNLLPPKSEWPVCVLQIPCNAHRVHRTHNFGNRTSCPSTYTRLARTQEVILVMFNHKGQRISSYCPYASNSYLADLRTHVTLGDDKPSWEHVSFLS